MNFSSKFLHFSTFFICTVVLIIGGACSDDNEPAVESKLVNETWTGWYQHNNNSTAGIVFSVRFENDKTVHYYELNKETKGTWSMQGNQVELTFEDNEAISATFEGDSLKNVTSNSGKSIHDFRASGKLPSADELTGTTWTGKTQQGLQVDLGFNSYEVDLSPNLRNVLNEQVNYERHGNGIRLSDELTHEPHAYIVFQNGKMMGSGFSIALPNYMFVAEKSQ